ncbi:ferrous iron transport protein B [Tenacibaculum sp. SZ-18]|uniref:ferrous iron transport protein B n=1 Tax=Tenacibaculum sp. SZ-18 TaxID=754423 RepID=UPI000C2D5C99|nr:ferrous iron transport protein B [Tenacibaculum sp. SZ-18]AUC16476.1 ferrous iron transport protein B [Tenacibaculum sp. SZ-18]
MAKDSIQISLIGNPNTGKTSLFNRLTGLNQKVGNYPGITVDKKQGNCKLTSEIKGVITDLPGTYSINPTSLDESIVLKVLNDTEGKNFPDVILMVADIENLKRNLLLFTQIQDLGIPTVLAINMVDEMEKKGISINVEELEKDLQTKVILVSAKKNIGISELKAELANYKIVNSVSNFATIADKIDQDYFANLQNVNSNISLYKLWLSVTQKNFLNNRQEDFSSFLDDIPKLKKYQQKETIYRYQRINEILKKTYVLDRTKAKDLRSRLDRVFTHKFFGYFIFLGILALVFQSIFEWSSIPMDFIDGSFGSLSEILKEKLPEGMFTNLLTDGVIPGIGGVVIFIPQIAILFFLIAIMEESGYMSRVVFLMDKIMRRFGMSGKSIIPLISGTACAIPAVMATRTITSWKERLITILVTPFTTCAARLPVYAILIAIIIPNQRVLGFFNLQGLTLLGLYALGFIAAFSAAFILHKVLKIKSKSLFVIEMPDYKLPSIKNVLLSVVEKTKSFVFDAGKIILAISIILWFLATHGPSSYYETEEKVKTELASQNLSDEELAQRIASVKMEKSFIGIAGKAIEPVVKPMGYDWKLGIGLIASFAAREVFVGTLATIYSIEGVEDEGTIKERMEAEVNSETGGKRFDFATGMSLLLFYVFAMQCMATLAIVKRETKSWKWPIIQLVAMGVIAYSSATVIYQFLS